MASGPGRAATFIAHVILKNCAGTRMLSEMVGTIGVTASAPTAYYVITGEFNDTAWMLWLTNILFAGDQIHYVQPAHPHRERSRDSAPSSVMDGRLQLAKH